MKKYSWGLLALSLWASQAQAADKRLWLFSNLDYFTTDGADDEFEKVANAEAASIPGGSAEIRSNPGYGARIGVLFAVTQSGRTRLGASAGFWEGPKIKWKVNDVTPSPGTFGEIDRQQYARFLVEVRHLFPVSEGTFFQLGAGAGFANASTRQTSINTGSFNLSANNYDDKKSATGFAWEVSPGFVFNMEKTFLEIGLRYAQFPEIKGYPPDLNSNVITVKWNPIGAYIGFGF